MAAATTTLGFKAMTARYLSALRLRVAAGAAATVFHDVLHRTPVEDGHAHAAWLQAATDVAANFGAPNNARVHRAVADSVQFSSGDPTAEAAGYGSVDHGSQKTEVVIRNGLGFVSILEYGGVIRPIAPGGVKQKPAAKRPGEKGPLYGPRTASGKGMIFFFTSTGEPRFARSATLPPGHYLGRAMDAAANDMAALGVKVRRRRGTA